jgi:hypothetical protein
MSDYKTYEVKVYASGNRYWYLNGQLHREDGPAIEWANGNREWYLNGERHREDGPAIEWANGSRLWYLNGKRHREDGPACEYADGSREWYLNGRELPEEKHAKRTRKTADPCEGKVVEVEGRKYTLTAMKE